jgi:hypothetical protein
MKTARPSQLQPAAPPRPAESPWAPPAGREQRAPDGGPLAFPPSEAAARPPADAAEPPAVAARPGDPWAVCCHALRLPALLLVVAVAVYALGQTAPSAGRRPGPPSRVAAPALVPLPAPVEEADGTGDTEYQYYRWLGQLRHDNPRLYRIYLGDFATECARLRPRGREAAVDHHQVWLAALSDYDASEATRRTALPPPPE